MKRLLNAPGGRCRSRSAFATKDRVRNIAVVGIDMEQGGVQMFVRFNS